MMGHMHKNLFLMGHKPMGHNPTSHKLMSPTPTNPSRIGLRRIGQHNIDSSHIGQEQMNQNPLRPARAARNPSRIASDKRREPWQRMASGLRGMLFCWLFGTVLAVYAKPPITEAPVRILLFGDSLFAGYGFTDEADSFRGQIGEALARAGLAVELLPGAVSGDTTRGGRSRIEWTLAQPLDAAIVALGANDMLRGLPPEAMQENLNAILEAFAAAGVPVLLCGLPALSNFGADMQARYAEVFPHLAETRGLALHPNLLEGVAGIPEWNQADGIHPNRLGVAKMVDHILPAVVTLIDKAREAQTAEPGSGAGHMPSSNAHNAPSTGPPSASDPTSALASDHKNE